MSSERVMDVWDVASFPEPVIEALRAVDGAFVAHTLNVTQNRYEPDPTDEPRRLGLDVIARTMAGVTIRAWHYGRLCADEVELLMREGLWPTSQHRRNMRLRTRQDAGDLTSDDVASLTACCELNTDSFGVKDGAVFMTSTPRHPEEDYVCSLLASWGGEALARPRAGTPLGQRLALIGEPAVLEIALPFDLLPDWRQGLVVEAIEGGWLARQGCGVTENGRDLHVIEPLAPERILRVLRPCDHDFHTLGKSYPTAAVCLSPDGALRR